MQNVHVYSCNACLPLVHVCHVECWSCWSISTKLSNRAIMITAACHFGYFLHSRYVTASITALTGPNSSKLILNRPHQKKICSPLINHTALRNIHRPMEINQCAVLIYLYRPHKYSIIHQKLIVQLIIISTPGFTHTKNYTVSTKIYCTILTLILHHS